MGRPSHFKRTSLLVSWSTIQFYFQSEGTVTVRTRKYMTNRLLSRRQMVVDVLHPNRFDTYSCKTVNRSYICSPSALPSWNVRPVNQWSELIPKCSVSGTWSLSTKDSTILAYDPSDKIWTPFSVCETCITKANH